MFYLHMAPVLSIPNAFHKVMRKRTRVREMDGEIARKKKKSFNELQIFLGQFLK